MPHAKNYQRERTFFDESIPERTPIERAQDLGLMECLIGFQQERKPDAPANRLPAPVPYLPVKDAVVSA